MCEDAERGPLLEELDEARQRIWDACDRDIDKYFAMLQDAHRELLRMGWKGAPPPDEDGDFAGMEECWPSDPLLDEVNEARLEILAEHDNDYRKVWASYMEQEKNYADRMIDPSGPDEQDKSAA